MTKRQGLLLAFVLASGSTLLTYLWIGSKAPSSASSKSASAAGHPNGAVAVQPAKEQVTASGYAVPRSQRAIAIQVDAARGAGGLVRESDRVDVLLAAASPQARRLAETILQDVPILGPPAEQTDSVKATIADGRRELVMAVSPQDAQRLIAAQLHGTLVVTLRNPTDHEFAFVRPVPGVMAGGTSGKPAGAATAPPPSAGTAPVRAAAGARSPTRSAARRARRAQIAIASLPPEPLPPLLLPEPPENIRADLADRQVPLLLSPSSGGIASGMKTIELVRGTTVQTIAVKE